VARPVLAVDVLGSLGINKGLGDLIGGIGKIFTGGDTTAANDLMSNVNMGIVAPDAGGTNFIPLPGTTLGEDQG